MSRMWWTSVPTVIGVVQESVNNLPVRSPSPGPKLAYFYPYPKFSRPVGGNRQYICPQMERIEGWNRYRDRFQTWPSNSRRWKQRIRESLYDKFALFSLDRELLDIIQAKCLNQHSILARNGPNSRWELKIGMRFCIIFC